MKNQTYWVIKKQDRYYSFNCILERDINLANAFDSKDGAKIWAFINKKTDIKIIPIKRTTLEIEKIL